MDEKAAAKQLGDTGRPVLTAAIAALDALSGWDTAGIEQALKTALTDPDEGLGLKPRHAFGPVRVAVTGRTVSPPLFESLELLGRERSLERLRAGVSRMTVMWPDEGDLRSYDADTSTEMSNYVDYLANYRRTLQMKCAGLDAEQVARRSVPPSTLSLLGLIRHMAGVEHHWFRNVISNEATPRPYREDGNRDGDFDHASADDAVVAEARAHWEAEVANSEAVLEAHPDPAEQIVCTEFPEGIALRDIVVHMIEEYARHCGHADLLRECVDGRTGQGALRSDQQ